MTDNVIKWPPGIEWPKEIYITRNSKWTQIYWDCDEKGEFAYVRLVPDFMDTELSGFPHGISIGGIRFDNYDDANNAADSYDSFFDMMADNMD